MNFGEYKTKTRETAIYPKEQAIGYCYLGLISEFEEFKTQVFSTFTKLYYGLSDLRSPEEIMSEVKSLIGEMGDVCWYVARNADEHEIDFKVDEATPFLDEFKNDFDGPWLLLDKTLLSLVRTSGSVKKIIRDGEDNEKYENRITELRLILARALASIICITKLLGEVAELDLPNGEKLGKNWDKSWFTLEGILGYNYSKLTSRKERGVLQGDGDNR